MGEQVFSSGGLKETGATTERFRQRGIHMVAVLESMRELMCI